MILLDTSVWIRFLKGVPSARPVTEILSSAPVVTHPWVVAELALGHLGSKRRSILENIRLLPSLPEYPLKELLEFVEDRRLFGSDLSLVDIHLLYASIVGDVSLWTWDHALQRAAARFGKAYKTN